MSKQIIIIWDAYKTLECFKRFLQWIQNFPGFGSRERIKTISNKFFTLNLVGKENFFFIHINQVKSFTISPPKPNWIQSCTLLVFVFTISAIANLELGLKIESIFNYAWVSRQSPNNQDIDDFLSHSIEGLHWDSTPEKKSKNLSQFHKRWLM